MSAVWRPASVGTFAPKEGYYSWNTTEILSLSALQKQLFKVALKILANKQNSKTAPQKAISLSFCLFPPSKAPLDWPILFNHFWFVRNEEQTCDNWFCILKKWLFIRIFKWKLKRKPNLSVSLSSFFKPTDFRNLASLEKNKRIRSETKQFYPVFFY